MKRLLTLLALFLLLASMAFAQEKVVFTPQWTAQAQFAGFYMAKEKGFYEEEGLDVTILHVGVSSSKSPTLMLQEGVCQIAMAQLVHAIQLKSQGVDMVNVMQVSQNSGLMFVSQTPISSLNQLAGKRVGKWKSGVGIIGELFFNDFGIDVQWVDFINGVNLFVSGAVDATMCYSYSEYFQLMLARGRIPAENTIRLSSLGYNYPDDGVYVLRKYLEKHPGTIRKFVAASIKGWQYAREHEDETLDVVMRYVDENHILTNRVLQKHMLREVLSLQVNPGSGKADYSPVSRTTFDELQSALFQQGLIVNPVDYKDFQR